ncbi:MAG: DUF3368 domain-containing protein [Candidatus Jordarchaeaceae archaeon]
METSEAVRSDLINVMQVMDKEKTREIMEEYKVSLSNAEVIQLAKEINAAIVLANEEEIRDAAESSGFKVRGCLGVLVEAVKSKIISPRQAIQDIDNLVSSGYRISEDIINKVKENLWRWE